MRLHCDGRTVAYEMRTRTSLSTHNGGFSDPTASTRLSTTTTFEFLVTGFRLLSVL